MPGDPGQASGARKAFLEAAKGSLPQADRLRDSCQTFSPLYLVEPTKVHDILRYVVSWSELMGNPTQGVNGYKECIK